MCTPSRSPKNNNSILACVQNTFLAHPSWHSVINVINVRLFIFMLYSCFPSEIFKKVYHKTWKVQFSTVCGVTLWISWWRSKSVGTNQQKPQTADMNPNSDAKSSSLQPLFTIHITLETIGNIKTLALAEGKIMTST